MSQDPFIIVAALISNPKIAKDIEQLIDENFWILTDYCYHLFKGIIIKRGNYSPNFKRGKNDTIPERTVIKDK